ncbi:hypothetical protein OROMI_008784 [Orobanche minor]
MSVIGIHPETNDIRVEETHLERWNAFVEETDNDEDEDEDEVERNLFSNSDNLDGKGVNVCIEKLTSTRKRKNKDGADQVVENKKKPPTIDPVLEFLSKTVASPNVSKTERVSFALREMGVSKDRGDKYFVDAMRYLDEGNDGDIFLALENDTHKWMFLEDGIAPCETSYNPIMDDDVRRACMIVELEQMRRLLQPSIESGPTSQPQPQRSGGETGAEYTHRILNGRPDLCKEQLRLHRDTFLKFVDLMVARKLLSDGRFIKVAEQVGICLYILAKGASYRDVADMFQHSIGAISMYFRKDCIGELDGTHIKAVISDKDGVPFRGGKGTKTWNVWRVALLIEFSLSLMWDGK